MEKINNWKNIKENKSLIDFMEEEVAAQDTFFSKFEDIYFLGDVNRKEKENELLFQFNQEEAREQAKLLVQFFLTGDKPEIRRNSPVGTGRDLSE